MGLYLISLTKKYALVSSSKKKLGGNLRQYSQENVKYSQSGLDNVAESERPAEF